MVYMVCVYMCIAVYYFSSFSPVHVVDEWREGGDIFVWVRFVSVRGNPHRGGIHLFGVFGVIGFERVCAYT